jgi:hypothetical protein
MNFFVEPGFIITIPISFIKIGLNFSYCIQFGDQAFHLDKNKDNTLQDPVNNTSVKPQWNGIRAGISAFYTIPK